MNYLLLAILNAFLMAMGQTFWKLGMQDLEITSFADIIKAVFTPFVFIGLFIYGMTMFLWLYVINRADLSQVYPIQSLAFVFVLIISSIILREVITINRIIGVLVICAGAYIISIK